MPCLSCSAAQGCRVSGLSQVRGPWATLGDESTCFPVYHDVREAPNVGRNGWDTRERDSSCSPNVLAVGRMYGRIEVAVEVCDIGSSS